MKERPILFSAPMVRAILDGTKTQTRRVVKIPGVMPHTSFVITHPEEEIIRFDDGTFHYLSTAAMSGPYACPYGQPGDRLWVRETWGLARQQFDHESRDVVYRADTQRPEPDDRWRSSIHMPRWASRILLEVTDVRVQRLQDITEADVVAEGVSTPGPFAVHHFMDLWNSINGTGAWNANPWVWALSFRRVAR